MIVLLFVTQLVSAYPPLSPAAAAAVLARLDSPANRTGRVARGDCDGPRVFVLRDDVDPYVAYRLSERTVFVPRYAPWPRRDSYRAPSFGPGASRRSFQIGRAKDR